VSTGKAVELAAIVQVQDIPDPSITASHVWLPAPLRWGDVQPVGMATFLSTHVSSGMMENKAEIRVRTVLTGDLERRK
jgi:hypothetical protein